MANKRKPTKRTKRSGDSGDLAIGPRIRVARRALGLSQTSLAAQLGVSFQQVQKYENSRNRVSIGRLSDIATALGVTTTHLLTGGEERRRERGLDEGGQLFKRPGAFRLIKAFDRIRNRISRVALVELAESIANKP
jgi:transcriptional regulator with XRE-family HTH domain